MKKSNNCSLVVIISFLFFFFCACDKKSANNDAKFTARKSKDLDSLFNVWRADKNGCLGKRHKIQVLLLTEGIYKGMKMDLFFQLFGNPENIVNEYTDKFGTHRVYNYYISCGDSETPILIIWEKNNTLEKWTWAKQ
jgi:hypothetical protein